MSSENEEVSSSSYYDEDVVLQSDKGAALFIYGNEYYQNAYLTHWRDGNGFFIYPTGYKMAAEKLVELAEKEPYNADYLVFPIVFLYRQYLELRLKQLIFDGCSILGTSPDFPKTHRIDLLWESCKPVLHAIKLDDDPEVAWRVAEGIGNIEACILEFGHIDPTSMAFRYPVDKELTPFLDGLEAINIRHFGESMNNVANFLNGVALSLPSHLRAFTTTMVDIGLNDEFSEKLRKHRWLTRQQKQTES